MSEYKMVYIVKFYDRFCRVWRNLWVCESREEAHQAICNEINGTDNPLSYMVDFEIESIFVLPVKLPNQTKE